MNSQSLQTRAMNDNQRRVLSQYHQNPRYANIDIFPALFGAASAQG